MEVKKVLKAGGLFCIADFREISAIKSFEEDL
jgi:hypothetical protein